MRKRERAPRAVACALAVAAVACGGPGRPADAEGAPIDDTGGLPPLDLAVVGSAAKVRPTDVVAGAAAATLVAARNEFESFQIAVRATDAPVEGLTVSWGRPLAGPGGAVIPATHVTIHAERYVDVKTPSDVEGAPGRWPDALVPTVDTLVGEARSAFPIDVPAGECRVAWIDVLVPADAKPGVYQGSVMVRAEGRASSVPVRLTVLSFTLPSTASLRSSFGFSDLCRAFDPARCAADPDFRATLRQRFVQAALDDRVTLATPYAIQLTRGRSYGVDEFRRYFLPLLRGEGPTRLRGARLTTFRVNSHTDRNITGWEEELEADGVGDVAYVWSCDEPHFAPVLGDPAGNWRLCGAKLEADAAAWPAAPKMVTTHLQSSEDAGTTSRIDILTLNVELLHGPPGSDFPGDQRPLYDGFLADGARPRQLWLYSACGSHGCVPEKDAIRRGWAGGYQIDGPASQTRAMPWIVFTHRMQGLFYYDTVQLLATAWDDQYRYTGNGEGTLFYPGTPDRIGGATPIPIESIRLKLLRDGFEDYELLKFAHDRGRGAEALRIARGLFPAPYDATRSDAQIQAARTALARLVAGITGGPRP